MNELMNVGEGGLSPVEDLAQQAQYYSQRTAFDMLQLGRVLTQAKGLVAQGEWMDWVDRNAGLDIRGAQYFMQCYAKYGLDPEKAKLGKSKLIAMLPMTDKERDKLMANNDVSAMSVRELKEAVRKAREEEQEKAREAVEVMRQGNLIELAKQKEAADKAAPRPQVRDYPTISTIFQEYFHKVLAGGEANEATMQDMDKALNEALEKMK